jgi:dCTP deaminase
MTILSDRQIRALCLPPETYLDRPGYEAESRLPRSVPAVFPNDHIVRRMNQEMLARHTHPTTAEMKKAFVPMIAPFEAKSVRQITTDDSYIENAIRGDGIKYGGTRKVLSFGSTSYGYDVRLQEKFQIFTNVNGGEIDPKAIGNHCMVDGQMHTAKDGSRYVILPPNSYLLGVTVEYFRMPRDVLAICLGKSTYARAGAIVNATPIEPGFEGEVVIEIANSTSLPMRIYAGEGISQFLFFQGSEACEVSYADRGGKYQGQRGMQLGKV